MLRTPLDKVKLFLGLWDWRDLLIYWVPPNSAPVAIYGSSRPGKAVCVCDRAGHSWRDIVQFAEPYTSATELRSATRHIMLWSFTPRGPSAPRCVLIPRMDLNYRFPLWSCHSPAAVPWSPVGRHGAKAIPHRTQHGWKSSGINRVPRDSVPGLVGRRRACRFCH